MNTIIMAINPLQLSHQINRTPKPQPQRKRTEFFSFGGREPVLHSWKQRLPMQLGSPESLTGPVYLRKQRSDYHLTITTDFEGHSASYNRAIAT